MAQVLNAESINKYNQSIALTKQRMGSLQKQLIQLQGATPTPNGEPAVSTPSNTGPGSSFKPNGLTESQRVTEIARIQKELAAANESAKNLAATIDYLSGKAPKPKSAIPDSKPSTTLIGNGDKGKDPQKEADERLHKAVELAKREAEVTASALEMAYASGAVKEVDYLDQQLTILQDGILREQQLLRAGGKENTAEYAETQKRLNEVAVDYLGKRNKLEEDAIDAVKALIDADTSELKGQLVKRVAVLQIAYSQEETIIKNAVASRQISEIEGDQRVYDLKIQLLNDIATATAENARAIQTTSEKRINDLEAILRAAGQTEVEIIKALADERKKIEQERLEAEKKAAEDRVKIVETEEEKKQKIIEKAGEAIAGKEETFHDLREQRRLLEIDLANAKAKGDIERAQATANAIEEINIKLHEKTMELIEKAAALQ